MSKNRDKDIAQLRTEQAHNPNYVSNVESLRHFKDFNATDIIMKKQTWLWDGYIPDKTCTLFAGTGGIGKSTLLAYIIAAVSRGASFSINSVQHAIPEGKVILFSAEDNFEHTVVPRLVANNANLTNIQLIESTIDIDSKEYERFVDLDRDMHVLESKIKELGDVKLIVLDPVTAYIGRVKDNSAVEVRNFILRLNRLAEKYNLAIILNTHTRKKSTHGQSAGTAADEVMGSSAWYNTVRQAFSITRHHNDEKLIVFVCSKSNCGAKPDGVQYRIESVDLDYNGEIIPISRIDWQMGKVDMTADEAVHKDMYENKLDIDRAKELILRALAFSNKSAEDMRRIALDEGISDITLKRARQQLTREGTNIIMEQSQTDRRKMIWYIGK